MRSQRIHKILNTNATLIAVSMKNHQTTQIVVTKKRRLVKRKQKKKKLLTKKIKAKLRQKYSQSFMITNIIWIKLTL